MGSDVYIRAAVEWARVADVLREAGPVGDGLFRIVLALPRELAWCHLLVARGRPDAALSCLRAFLRDTAGPDSSPDAAALLDRFRRAIAARHPTVFARPAA